MDREALLAAIRTMAAAAWSFVAALVAAAVVHSFTGDAETQTLVGMLAWLGAFLLLLWKLPK